MSALFDDIHNPTLADMAGSDSGELTYVRNYISRKLRFAKELDDKGAIEFWTEQESRFF